MWQNLAHFFASGGWKQGTTDRSHAAIGVAIPLFRAILIFPTHP
jgi:hypothetical protein